MTVRGKPVGKQEVYEMGGALVHDYFLFFKGLRGRCLSHLLCVLACRVNEL